MKSKEGINENRKTVSVYIVLSLMLGAALAGIFFHGLRQIKATEKIDVVEAASEEDKTINMKGLFEKIPAANIKETAFCARKARLSTKDEIKKVCAALKAKEEARQDGAYAEALALEQILRSRLTDRQKETLKAYEVFLYEYAKYFMEKTEKTFEDYEKYADEDFMGAKFTLFYLDEDEIPELAIALNGFEIGSSIYIYTYKDGEVVPVGGPNASFGCYGEVGYVEKEGILLSGYERRLQGHYDVYRMDGTEMNCLLWIDEYWHWDSEENPKVGEGYYTYRIDKKEASEAVYMEQYHIYEEYKENEKRVQYRECFLMLNGNIKENLNNAMGQLALEKNPFFYSGKDILLSADLKYEATETWDAVSGKLQVKWLKRYDNGDLYKLSVEGIKEGPLGPERKNIYLYVTPDKIYRLWSYYYDEDGHSVTFYDNDDLLMETFYSDEILIENGEVVCCMEKVEYKEGEGRPGKNNMGVPNSEVGKHVTIIPDGERITYSRVDVKQNGEPDFYETFVWERGKGLIQYKSGFRAEAEILYIENITIKNGTLF